MNKKIATIIIDDEAPAREVIRNYLQDYPEIDIIAECDNGFAALKKIQDLQPELVFLDIQMPKLTGFEMLELLDEPPVIIFSTAYDQYALKAFQVNAADYLLKPYNRERFDEALKRALVFVGNKAGNTDKVNQLKAHLSQNIEYLERVAVKSGSQIFVVPVQKLLYLEAQDDYVMLHTKEDSYLKQQTLKYFESHLDPGAFLRIHRSYMVRISAIKQIESHTKDSHRVSLINGRHLPVSKSGHARLKEVLK
jgi:two-component system LytT family response regulator